MSKLDDLITLGRTELGKPYSYGAEGPNMFDCSGLMQFLFGGVGIQLPRTAAQQQQYATPITTPVVGDLVFYGRPATHVGLYLGGGKMLDAPHSGSVVQIQDVYGTPTYGRVPALGNTTTATLSGIAATPVGWAQDLGLDPTQWLASIKPVLLQGVFIALGLGLVGFGLWRAVSAQKAST